MSEPRGPDDDQQLASELERRSRTVSLSHDWARHELLPGVSAAIDSRPQRVATSRGPAFAGLASAAAILLVLVVALPRLVPSPGSTEPAVAHTSRPASSSGPIRPELLSAQEFAVEVLTGRLRSATVLVDGTIGQVQEQTYGGDLSCRTPWPTCLMGRLERTDPSVDVYASPTNTVEDDPVRTNNSAREWPWVYRPSAPVSGALLLSVDRDGVIEFLGRVDAVSGTDSLTVADAAQIDVESLALDDVVLVEGWLWSPEGPGVDISIDCVMPSVGPLPGLPNRYCQPTSSLIDEYRQSGPADDRSTTASLHVQRNAAQVYGVRTDRDPRIFAIAPRLYGYCFPGPPPCWQWDVVGRLTVEANEPTPTPVRTNPGPTPMPPAGVRFECAGPPLPPGETPPPGPIPIVIDETGLVEACLQTDSIEELVGRISVSNPFENNAIEVVWANGPCDAAIEFTFRASDSGYSLAGDRPGECAPGLGEPLPIYIRFSQPMPAASVAPTLDGYPCGSFDSTSLNPQLPAPSFVDETGLVGWCSTGNLPLPSDVAFPVIENGDDPVDLNLLISWVGTSCERDARVTFARSGERFAVTLDKGDSADCPGAAVRRVILYLSEPVDAGLIDLTILPDGFSAPNPTPTAMPQVMTCGYDGPGEPPAALTQVVDHTGTLNACWASPREEPAVPITVTVGEQPEMLEVIWQITCSWMPTTVELWNRDDGPNPLRGTLLIVSRSQPDGCRPEMAGQAVVLSLATPVLASDVESYLTSTGTGIDWVENDSGTFQLELEGGAADYAVGEPIDITASLLYTGATDVLEVTGNFTVAPVFGIEQLDGDLLMGPGPFLAICPRSEELRRDEPVQRTYKMPTWWPAEHQYAVFYERWVHDDGRFGLPAGTYRIFARSGFSLGGTCSATPVELEASIFIHVR